VLLATGAGIGYSAAGVMLEMMYTGNYVCKLDYLTIQKEMFINNSKHSCNNLIYIYECI
jgi:hypothetical protein